MDTIELVAICMVAGLIFVILGMGLGGLQSHQNDYTPEPTLSDEPSSNQPTSTAYGKPSGHSSSPYDPEDDLDDSDEDNMDLDNP